MEESGQQIGWWHHESIPEYVRRGFTYAEDITEGRIVAGLLCKLACKRSLKWANEPPEGVFFDVYAANHICEFISGLKHIKGEWAKSTREHPGGKNIHLEDWQCWQLIIPFGFKYLDSGYRIIRQVYYEIARKNAKSTIAAGVALYLQQEDDEPGAEVYSAATSRDQASIIFKVAKAQEIKSPHDGISVLAHSLEVTDKTHPAFGSLLKALSSEGSTMDGLNIHGAINDELHAWVRRDTYEVIETATGSRTQPMIWNVTTSGTNFEGVCIDLRAYMVQLLEGTLEDIAFWGCIWTIDKKDDWQDRSCWIKANPNLGVSVYTMDMETLARKALSIVKNQTAFLNKRLNVWTNSAESWMNMMKWEACGDKKLKLEDFKGMDCWLGGDFASKSDIASLGLVFPVVEDGVMHFYNFVKNYLPEAAVKDAVNAGHYDGWNRAGWLTVTPGTVLDIDVIEEDTVKFGDMFNIREICIDPAHNACQYAKHMELEFPGKVIEVRPTVLNFSDSSKYMEARVREGTWHHQDDPCYTWCISNVEIKPDMKDNQFPRKPQSGKAFDRKIDPAIATLQAFCRVLADEGPNVFDRDLVIL